MEKILIIMASYHPKIEWIERAINSIKGQSYANFDCYVVKDGCKKIPECEVCNESCKFFQSIIDPRFKFYKMPVNFGSAGWGPRNFALLNTKHDLIAYLDDDNWYEPNHLESLYESIKDKDMSYTGTRIYNDKYIPVFERIHPFKPKKGYIDTSEILHRRKLIDIYGYWRKVKKGNDWDLVSRWKEFTYTHTNKITLNFYMREGCGIHRD